MSMTDYVWTKPVYQLIQWRMVGLQRYGVAVHTSASLKLALHHAKGMLGPLSIIKTQCWHSDGQPNIIEEYATNGDVIKLADGGVSNPAASASILPNCGGSYIGQSQSINAHRGSKTGSI